MVTSFVSVVTTGGYKRKAIVTTGVQTVFRLLPPVVAFEKRLLATETRLLPSGGRRPESERSSKNWVGPGVQGLNGGARRPRSERDLKGLAEGSQAPPSPRSLETWPPSTRPEICAHSLDAPFQP